MAAATSVNLTPSDSSTLHRLFDPEASPAADTLFIDPSLPPDAHYDAVTASSLATAEREAIAIAEAEPRRAKAALDSLLEKHPLYASAYNNRAQLRRMLKSPPEDVLADLTKAIELASPKKPMDAVSKEAAKVLGMAYTQRGAVFLSRSRAGGGQDDEERAAREFEMGGRWGNELGKKLGRELNPYAKLCGAIVKEAIKAEYGG